MMRLLPPAAALLLFLGLSACAAIDAITGNAPPPPPCPEVSVLPEAATVTRFREGPGRDIIDEIYSGKIFDISRVCEHDIDEDTGEGTLSMEIHLVIQAERGAANTDRRARFDYFVALTDSTKKKIFKNEVFALPAAFPGNFNRISIADEPVELTIPLKKGQTGKDFLVFVGFQLNREEMKTNRLRGQGGRRERAVPLGY